MKYVRQATLGDLSEISAIFEDTKIISESIPENGKTSLMIILRFIVWPSRASIKGCI